MAETDKKTILIVDDEEGIQLLLRAGLAAAGYAPVTVGTGEAALEYLQRNRRPAVMLLDLNLPGIGGLEVLRRAAEIVPRQKVIMISCVGDASKVVAAMKLGATDYLVKPFATAALETCIANCIEEEAEAAGIKHQGQLGPLPFLCQSAAMDRIRETASRVAPTDVPVLIVGESGVGKEVVARYLHYNSKRASEKFLKVNCAALPSELLESELFGYERGAFTGAASAKPGKFELADGGTLFLDEIGEMHPFLQAKLLHVLQDGRYFRLGASNATRVNVRIVAATNINIAQALADGKLRQDLYYRLNVFSVSIPPLRERAEEIPLFAEHFLNKYAPGKGRSLSAGMLQRLTHYSWPGNLRELENFVRRLVILGDESLMEAELNELVAAAPRERQAVAAAAASVGSTRPASAPVPTEATPASGPVGLKDLKREAERRAIQAALESTQWRRKEAAKLLNISYKALLYKMRELELG